MKAAIFHKQADIRCDHVEDQRIDLNSDVILKVILTPISGSDLYT